ncbi:MAG: hypothetical protein DHS20C02_20190 [Micavibrio sp.]|nr:MAG: hypothetical protein DHS20C02_20190 [Micavibrio sp.]
MADDEIEMRLRERLNKNAAESQREAAERAEQDKIWRDVIPKLNEIEWPLLRELKGRFQPYLDRYGLECSVLKRKDIPRATAAQNLRELWQDTKHKKKYDFSNDAYTFWCFMDKPELVFYHGNTGKRTCVFAMSPWSRYSDIPENPDLSSISYSSYVESLEKVRKEGFEDSYYQLGKRWGERHRPNSEFMNQDQALEYLKERLVDYLEYKKSKSFPGLSLG